MMRTRRSAQKGFTIIELLIAMTFLTFILIFTATVMVQIMRTYNKGLAVKEIDENGRAIVEEVTRNLRLVQSANSSSVDPLIYTAAIGEGRLCVGQTTYVWNAPNDDSNKFVGENEDLHIVKLRDTTAQYCSNPSQDIPPADAVRLSNGRVRIPEFNAERSADGRLLHLRVVFSTNNQDAPILEGGRYTCDVSNFFGSFCAVGEFESTVYLRNGG
jgi:prepilin-type N-terminal cleavage/methylation domain-containing protein